MKTIPSSNLDQCYSPEWHIQYKIWQFDLLYQLVSFFNFSDVIVSYLSRGSFYYTPVIDSIDVDTFLSLFMFCLERKLCNIRNSQFSWSILLMKNSDNQRSYHTLFFLLRHQTLSIFNLFYDIILMTTLGLIILIADTGKIDI
jgi:hypothetical protein